MANYSEEDANQMLVNLLKEYPGLAGTVDPKNTKVVFASPERILASKIHGRGGHIEYWPSNEKGIEGYKHPVPGTTVLELHNQEAKSNPFLLKQLIFGDLLHSMQNDNYFWNLRDQFAENYLPEILKYEESQGRPGVWGKKGEDPYSRHDAYIRAKLVAPNTPGYSGWDNRMYSPAQLKIIEKMQRYLSNGIPEE